MDKPSRFSDAFPLMALRLLDTEIAEAAAKVCALAAKPSARTAAAEMPLGAQQR